MKIVAVSPNGQILDSILQGYLDGSSCSLKYNKFMIQVRDESAWGVKLDQESLKTTHYLKDGEGFNIHS